MLDKKHGGRVGVVSMDAFNIIMSSIADVGDASDLLGDYWSEYLLCNLYHFVYHHIEYWTVNITYKISFFLFVLHVLELIIQHLLYTIIHRMVDKKKKSFRC